MDNRAEIKEFLATRRARISPEQVGFPPAGSRRRVPGLRREELAMLAGVSVEYYTRIERGSLAGVSATVLDAIARVLRLDDVERTHLQDLARGSGAAAGSPRPTRTATTVRPGVRWLIDAMSQPTVVQNRRHDVVAANSLGKALYGEILDGPAHGNLARYTFLDTRSRTFFPDWDEFARLGVATLHAEAARDPFNGDLTGLIGELSTRSEEFRTLWAAHDVHEHRSGRKRMRHPVIGLLELDFEGLDIAADDDLRIYTYSAPPGTASADGLAMLASWVATGADAQSAASERMH